MSTYARYRRLVFVLLGVLFLQACGYSVKREISPVTPPPTAEGLPKVVILPFADFSSSAPYEAWKKNVLIMEALQDELLKAGFATVPYEDVVQFLIQKGVIRQTSRPITPGTNVLYRELAGDWSPEMKQEIWKAIEQNQQSRGKTVKTTPLDRKTLVELGKNFGARYIIRGRIITFSDTRYPSLNPLKSGIVPFVFHLGSRTIFGVADSQAYEGLNQAAAGAALGASVGALMQGSVELGTSLVDPALVGSVIGSGVGLVQAHTGKVSEARIQLRLFVQDAQSGELIWSNRAEIEVSPGSVFVSSDREKLFSKAVNEAARVLVGDFASNLAAGNLPPVLSESVAPEIEAAKRAAEEAQRAALQARQAAEEASAAAVKSERIFEKSLTK